MDLKDKTIVITGSGRGLGAAMAKRLAAQGCMLALIDLDEASLADVKAATEQAGSPQVETYKTNVAVGR